MLTDEEFVSRLAELQNLGPAGVAERNALLKGQVGRLIALAARGVKRNAKKREKEGWPDWLPLTQWEAFVEMRQRIRKPMSARAKELVIAKLDRLRSAGCDPGAVLDQSTMNSWQGVFEVRGDQNANGFGSGTRPGSRGNAHENTLLGFAMAGGLVGGDIDNG